MTIKPKVIVIALVVLGAAAYWLADAAADSLLFGQGAFWDVLVLNVSAQEAFSRGAAILIVCLGVLLSRCLYLARGRHAGEKPCEGEDELAILADRATDSIFVLSASGEVLFANKVAAEMFGYRSSEMHELDVFSLVHPADRSRAQDIFRQRMAGESAPGHYQLRGLHKSGSEFPMEVVASTALWRGQPAAVGMVRDVSEQKELADALTQYENALDGFEDLVAGVDRNYRYFLANKIYLSYHQVGRDETIGRTVADLHGEEAFEKEIKPLMDRCLRGERVRYQDSVMAADGQNICLEVTYYPLRGAEQSPVGLIILIRDITERRQAQGQLRDSEEKYRHLFDGLIDAALLVDPQTGFVLEANLAAEKILGRSRDEIMGMHQSVLYPPETADECWERFRSHVEEGQVAPEEAEIVRKDGAVVPVQVSTLAVMLGGRRLALGLFRDITERKRQEEAFHRQRHFDWSIMDAGQVVIVLVDTEGRVVRLSRFGQELTGYSEDEVRGKDCFEIAVPARNRARAREGFKRVLAGEPVQGLETPILTKAGRTVLVRWYSSLLDDPRENIIGVVGVGQDVTELRQKDEQLHRAARMETIGRLAGGIAHDFNNLLAVIRGHADILAKSPLTEDEASAEDILEIRDAAARGAKLTNALLDFGQQRVAEPCVIQLNQLVLSMESILRWTLGGEIRLGLRLSKDVRHVTVDPGRMEEVLLNLAVNGRDAMPGGGWLRIETANRQVTEANVEADAELPPPGEYVVLSVADNGVGMDERTRRRIFEPFFTTKGDGEGTGLGLATCYGIVTQSSGKITVASRPGKGSTFRVFLPATDEPITEPIGTVAEEDVPIYPLRASARILLVDDDGPMRRMLGRALRKSGYSVLEAVHPLHALPLGEHYEGPIDVLVTDAILPYMDGAEIAGRIKAVRPNMKVIYISGRPRAMEKIPPEAEFLPKPFTTDRLVRTIQRVLADGGGA